MVNGIATYLGVSLKQVAEATRVSRQLLYQHPDAPKAKVRRATNLAVFPDNLLAASRLEIVGAQVRPLFASDLMYLRTNGWFQ